MSSLKTLSPETIPVTAVNAISGATSSVLQNDVPSSVIIVRGDDRA
jgi:hypothetical protein